MKRLALAGLIVLAAGLAKAYGLDEVTVVDRGETVECVWNDGGEQRVRFRKTGVVEVTQRGSEPEFTVAVADRDRVGEIRILQRWTKLRLSTARKLYDDLVAVIFDKK